jgi:putative endonuclease
MAGTKNYFVYIMANQSRNLYVGVTNNIRRRAEEHKAGVIKGFAHRYNIDKLVYVESFSDIGSAITREKKIKNWRREKKLRLINQENPEWHDVSDGL